jgi:hypothetical protein
MKFDKNTSDIERLIAESDERSLRCSICNSQRNEIKFKDIPNNLRKVFLLSMKKSEFKENPTLVYCKKCDLYSMLSSLKTGPKI